MQDQVVLVEARVADLAEVKEVLRAARQVAATWDVLNGTEDAAARPARWWSASLGSPMALLGEALQALADRADRR